MSRNRARLRTTGYAAMLCAVTGVVYACTDQVQTPTATIAAADVKPVVQIMTCTANTAALTVSCEPAAPQVPSGLRLDQKIIGGQGLYVRLTSSSPGYNSGTQIFSFNLTVQNLTNSAMASSDGALRDDEGVRVFFSGNPVATPSGTITAANPTGLGAFTGANQAYFQYGGKIGGVDQTELGADGLLASAEVSAAKPWQLNVPSTVTSFTFNLYVSTQTPSGPVTSAAPQVDSVKPAILIPGDSAFVYGKSLNATASSNTVNVGGVTAPGSRLDAKGLKFTVPCTLSGSVPVSITTNSMTGAAKTATLQGNVRTLAVGQAVIIRNPAQVPCNEIAATGVSTRYFVTIYSANTTANANDPFQTSADPIGELVNVDQSSDHVTEAPTLPAADITRDPYDFGYQAMVNRKHFELLERNRTAFNKLSARFAGDKRMRTNVISQSLVVTPPPLTKTIRVANITAPGPLCSNYLTVQAHRVYYSGKIAIYEDDSTPVALKDSANATMHTYYTKIGDQFNNDMEPILTANFGNVLRRDAVTDNNGVLIALFTPKINTNFTGVAGFVVSCDQFPNDEGAGNTNTTSNFGEYFYAYQPTLTTSGFGTPGTPDYWYRTIRSTFIHESKHVVSFAARVENGAAFFEQSAMEEGMARTSEEMWGRNAIYAPIGWKSDYGYGSFGDPKNIYCDLRPTGFPECTFTRGPTNVMQRHFASYYSNMIGQNGRFFSPFGPTSDDTQSLFYASSWSLIRYVVDHFATGTEAAFLTALTQSTASSPGGTLAAVSGVPLDSILGGWAIAQAADNYPGLDLLTASPLTQMLTWDWRNIYAGLNSDVPGTFTQAYPGTGVAHSFGSFAPLATATMRGGGFLWYNFSGTQTSPQLIRLLGSGGIALPSTLRLAIVRVQ